MALTTIQLFKDVGFSDSYNYVADFANETARNTWFDAKEPITIQNANYNKTQNELDLKMSYDDAVEYSYCKILVGQKWFYCWIKSCDLINEEVTRFKISVDPWQTYLFDFSVGEGFISRQHENRFSANKKAIPRANSTTTLSAINKYNRRYRIQTPEMEYDGKTIQPLHCIITYIENVNGTKKFESVVFPLAINESSSNPTIIVGTYRDGKICNYPTIKNITDGTVFKCLGLDPNSVTCIAITPILDSDLYSRLVGSVPDIESLAYRKAQTSTLLGGFITNTTTDRTLIPVALASEWTFTAQVVEDTTFSYDNTIPTFQLSDEVTWSVVNPDIETNVPYSPNNEPMLFISPFFNRYIVDENGHDIFEIPDSLLFENLASMNILILGMSYKAILETSNVNLYLGLNPGEEMSVLGGTTIYMCKGLDIPEDAWLNYVLTQRDNDRAMVNSTTNQAIVDKTISMGLMGGLIGSRNTSNVSALKNVGVGAVLGLGTALASGISEHHFAWEQQEIKEKQIRDKSSALLLNGEGMTALQRGKTYFEFIETKCDDVTFNKYAEEFKKYGYVVNKTGIPQTNSRRIYNYVLTADVEIKGNINQDIKRSIAQIFNSGVTIWHTASGVSIGNYQYENWEVAL